MEGEALTQDVTRLWRPTRIDVDLDAVRDNVARLRRGANTDVCAVVKADGYGHGAVPVARAALAGGATWLAVALVEEGIVLREAGIDVPILLLSEPALVAINALLDGQLTPAVFTDGFIDALDDAAVARDIMLDVHLKVDTGMSRVGVPEALWSQRMAQLASARRLRVTGMFTHLARADEPHEPTTSMQISRFDAAVALAHEHGLKPTCNHTANSAGTLLHPDAHKDMVRPGIAIYGLSADTDVDAADHGLVPALQLSCNVAFVKHIQAGTEVSYGHRWQAPHDGWLATLPIGYADGVPRALRNQVDVLIGGRRKPMVGTVTMDQVLVFCGHDEPSIGDEVVLIGRQGDEQVRVEAWAKAADTITYEIVTQLTARLPRHHHGLG